VNLLNLSGDEIREAIQHSSHLGVTMYLNIGLLNRLHGLARHKLGSWLRSETGMRLL